MTGTPVYHVTERADAVTIMEEGFQGGWGDLGFGVYFYGTIESAQTYLDKGGWDERLKDPVILEIVDDSIVPITGWDLDPSWDPETYADMLWREMDDDNEDAVWKPESIRLADEPAPYP